MKISPKSDKVLPDYKMVCIKDNIKFDTSNEYIFKNQIYFLIFKYFGVK